jgi:NADH-quinone oxidoreductase subunit G
MTQIEIEIDGKKIKTQSGKMLIEVADENGIHIPRFCYHKKLSIAANCRMCLVEVEKAPKTLPACATPINDGMKVFTQSKATKESQHAVMEFLLINHPLDCPICDQGGQCELQDLSYEFGNDSSSYQEGKRSVEGDNFGPLIETQMTRCIHCTRCVRFGKEVAGIREVGAIGRGEHTEIGTYIAHTVSHELSGNIIDLCPVGALTSKPFAFKARAWEMTQIASVAAHDCVGSAISLHARRGEIMRVVPRDNEALNEAWISDRDRFSYTGLAAADRVEQPMIKENGQWREVEWSVALDYVAEAVEKITAHDGDDALAMFMSPNATCEELYLAQKLTRSLKSDNIDYRLRQSDFTAANDVYPVLNCKLDELPQQQAVLLIAANVRQEQPIVAHRLRQASLKGCKVMPLSLLDGQENFDVAHKRIVTIDEMLPNLLSILKASITLSDKSVDIASATQLMMDVVKVDEHAKAVAAELVNSEQALICLGAMASHHPAFASLYYVAQLISQVTGANLGRLTDGANATGGFLVGAQPQKPGNNVKAMIAAKPKAVFLHDIDSDHDVASPVAFSAMLEQAPLVVSISPFANEKTKSLANVILPCAGLGETSGTYVNALGQWQSFMGVVKPFAAARPAWKIYRVLANMLKLDGFEFESSEGVLQEAKAQATKVDLTPSCTEPNEMALETTPRLHCITPVALYRSDNLVRRAQPLQELVEQAFAQIHSDLAEKLSVKEGGEITLSYLDKEFSIPVKTSAKIPLHSVVVGGGSGDLVSLLGTMYAEVKVKKS